MAAAAVAAAAPVDRATAQALIPAAVASVIGGQALLYRTQAAVAAAAAVAGNYSDRATAVATAVFDTAVAADAAGVLADPRSRLIYKFLAILCAVGNDGVNEHVIKMFGDLLHDIKVQGIVHPIPIMIDGGDTRSMEAFAQTLVPVAAQAAIGGTIADFKRRESNIHDRFKTYGFKHPFAIYEISNLRDLALYLLGQGFSNILMDSQFGNIYKRSAFSGFKSIDATVSRVDGATKVGPVILTANGVTYEPHTEPFTIAFFYGEIYHTMSVDPDGDVRIVITFPDGGTITVTSPCGLSVNAIAEQVGIPAPRGTGKAGTEANVVYNPPAGGGQYYRHHLMLVKTITDWAQIVYCLWLNYLGIPTVFVTNDEFCCELAAILKLPFVIRTPSSMSTVVHVHKYLEEILTAPQIFSIIKSLYQFKTISTVAGIGSYMRNAIGATYNLVAEGRADNIIKQCIDRDIELLKLEIYNMCNNMRTEWGNLSVLLLTLGVPFAGAGVDATDETIADAAGNITGAAPGNVNIDGSRQILERCRFLIPTSGNIAGYLQHLFTEGLNRIFHKYNIFFKELKYQYSQAGSPATFGTAISSMVTIIFSLLESIGWSTGINIGNGPAVADAGVDGNENFKNILRHFSFFGKNGGARGAIDAFRVNVPSFLIAPALYNSRGAGYILGKTDKFNVVMEECLFSLKRAIDTIVAPAAVTAVIHPVAEAVVAAAVVAAGGADAVAAAGGIEAVVPAGGIEAAIDAAVEADLDARIAVLPPATKNMLVPQPAAAAVGDVDDDPAVPQDTAIKKVLKDTAGAIYVERNIGVPGPGMTARELRAAMRAAAKGPHRRLPIPNISDADLFPVPVIPVGGGGNQGGGYRQTGGVYESDIPDDDWFSQPLFIHEITPAIMDEISDNKNSYTKPKAYSVYQYKPSIGLDALAEAVNTLEGEAVAIVNASMANETLYASIMRFSALLLNVFDELEVDANESGLYGIWDDALRDINIMCREVGRGAESRISFSELILQWAWFMYASPITSHIFLNALRPVDVNKIAIIHLVLEARVATPDPGTIFNPSPPMVNSLARFIFTYQNAASAIIQHIDANPAVVENPYVRFFLLVAAIHIPASDFPVEGVTAAITQFITSPLPDGIPIDVGISAIKKLYIVNGAIRSSINNDIGGLTSENISRPTTAAVYLVITSMKRSKISNQHVQRRIDAAKEALYAAPLVKLNEDVSTALKQIDIIIKSFTRVSRVTDVTPSERNTPNPVKLRRLKVQKEKPIKFLGKCPGIGTIFIDEAVSTLKYLPESGGGGAAASPAYLDVTEEQLPPILECLRGTIGEIRSPEVVAEQLRLKGFVDRIEAGGGGAGAGAKGGAAAAAPFVVGGGARRATRNRSRRHLRRTRRRAAERSRRKMTRRRR
jgi:hypothetical protein